MTDVNTNAAVFDAARRNKLDVMPHDVHAARQAVIHAVYAKTGKQRTRIMRVEVVAITNVSGSELDRKGLAKPGSKLHGDHESRYPCYDLDKVDQWIQKKFPEEWGTIHAVLEGTPPVLPSVSQIKTIEDAVKVPLAVLLDIQSKLAQAAQIIEIAPTIETLIRAAQAGKTVGFATLAETMTKYQWTSATKRERVRRVWLRLLDSEQERIEQFRELDRQQAIKIERASLERTLPPARHKGKSRRPPL